MNCAVVAGLVPSEPEVRMMPSGASIASLSVTCEGPDGRRTSVPVSVPDPPAWIEALDPGTEIIVFGRVQRRFFRARGATASRVELVAEMTIRASSARRRDALMRRALARLSAWD
jgi:single-stranded DNA-binding protein